MRSPGQLTAYNFKDHLTLNTCQHDCVLLQTTAQALADE